jgi:hypothetical protein
MSRHSQTLVMPLVLDDDLYRVGGVEESSVRRALQGYTITALFILRAYLLRDIVSQT